MYTSISGNASLIGGESGSGSGSYTDSLSCTPRVVGVGGSPFWPILHQINVLAFFSYYHILSTSESISNFFQ